MHAKTGLGEASSAGESRKSAADVADAGCRYGSVFAATWDRKRGHLGPYLPPFGMVFVADARECRFLMKPKVKPKVVI